MKAEKVMIPVRDEASVSGVVVVTDKYDGKSGIIFAHGAGNDMNQSMIVFLSEEMANAGYLTLRFNFPYKEQARKAPDRPEVLYRTWEAACRFLHSNPDHRAEHIVAAGKSMGGRIASQMVAEGRLPVEHLIFLGYPLHPAGKKDKLRDQHLYGIRVPMLFFTGTRDQLCDLELLNSVLSRLTAPWQLEVIEGGDHSFNVPKAARVSLEEIYGGILDGILKWLNGP